MIHIPGGARYDKVEAQAELDVSSAYYISVPDGWLHKERFLELAELIYVTEGELHLLVSGQSIDLSAGEAYLVRQYTHLTGACPSAGACSFYTVSFRCNLQKYDVLYGHVLQISSRASYAETLLNNLRYFDGREAGEGYLLDASFALLLEALCACRNKEPERIQMHGILDYINDHISSPLTMEEISEHFHYSSDYISKIFREQFGVTVKQYIIEKKLTVAKRLLTASDLTVRQVGKAVGFAEPVLFEKFFKYHTKLTPKKYRELYL